MAHATHPFGLLSLLPALPLLGAAINGLLGSRLQARFGRRAIDAVAIGAMALSALLALYAVVFALLPLPPGERQLVADVFQGPMLSVGPLQVHLAFCLDPLSAILLLIITFVGTLIHVYATGYMADEASYWRFFSYLNLFVASMLLLVLADNLLVMFFGWEGVGLCSYLLIGFWYRERENGLAGMKAFVVNRVGDAGLLLGIALLFWSLGGVWSPTGTLQQPTLRGEATAVDAQSAPLPLGPTLTFRALAEQLDVQDGAGHYPVRDALTQPRFGGLSVATVICLLLLLGAMGKSAQFPLHVWLPDAMAGPTPVSALIHAATMVTAGVYLIARLNGLFALAPIALTVVAAVGAFTALFAALIGICQYDLKKVLAYSTISQLGFMMLGVGVGATWAGVFHLLTHACFKACLFLGAGSLIHAMHARHHAAPEELEHGAEDDELSPSAKGHVLGDLWSAADPHDPQDLRNMRRHQLGASMKTTRWTYLAACWAIAGFPWAAGFYSKDEILWRAFSNGQTSVAGPLLWLVAFVAAGCTSFYMFRSYYLAFGVQSEHATSHGHGHAHGDAPAVMTTVLAILGGASLLIGLAVGLPSLWTHHAPLLEQWLEPLLASAAESLRFRESHSLEWLLMVASVGVAAGSWSLARALYGSPRTSPAHFVVADRLKHRWTVLHRCLYGELRLHHVVRHYVVAPTMGLARFASRWDGAVFDGAVNGVAALARGMSDVGGWIDRLLVDGLVNGVASLCLVGGRGLRKLQTGRVNQYVAGIVFGLLVLVAVASLR